MAVHAAEVREIKAIEMDDSEERYGQVISENILITLKICLMCLKVLNKII